MPDKEETTKFWQNIGDNPKDHNTNAAWITSAESELGEVTMDDVTITADMIKKHLRIKPGGKQQISGNPSGR